jgi:hypothetical protein
VRIHAARCAAATHLELVDVGGSHAVKEGARVPGQRLSGGTPAKAAPAISCCRSCAADANTTSAACSCRCRRRLLLVLLLLLLQQQHLFLSQQPAGTLSKVLLRGRGRGEAVWRGFMPCVVANLLLKLVQTTQPASQPANQTTHWAVWQPAS